MVCLGLSCNICNVRMQAWKMNRHLGTPRHTQEPTAVSKACLSKNKNLSRKQLHRELQKPCISHSSFARGHRCAHNATWDPACTNKVADAQLGFTLVLSCNECKFSNSTPVISLYTRVLSMLGWGTTFTVPIKPIVSYNLYVMTPLHIIINHRKSRFTAPDVPGRTWRHELTKIWICMQSKRYQPVRIASNLLSQTFKQICCTGDQSLAHDIQYPGRSAS